MLFLVTNKYVHVLSAAELHIRSISSDGDSEHDFEERLMKEVHPCFETEEAIEG